MFLFSLLATETFSEHSQIFMVGPFCEDYKLKVVNYSSKKAPPWNFGWVLNMALGNIIKKCHLKRYFPCYVKCFVSLSLPFRANEKNMLQKEIKYWAFEFYLLNWGIQPVYDFCWFLEFFVKRRGLGLFFAPKSLALTQ